MTRQLLRANLLAFSFCFLNATPLLAQQSAKQNQPRVEVVFCVDTTGSMGGLINAAKQKIWSICSQIATGTPTPDVRVGLVAYRDRGDQFVTKHFDLSNDLDAVYGELMKFQAAGGGDEPESVNQALHEAVTKSKWSKDKKTLKIIFLVGDAPPKTYADDVKYQETCQTAVKNNIIINTIQCGKNTRTTPVWQDICRLAEGSFVQIDQGGGPITVVSTPYDKKLAEINGKLVNTTLVFGSHARQSKGKAQNEAALKLAAPAAADRAGFYGNSMRGATYDLLENVKNGKAKLKDLKKEELPPQLQGKSIEEQKAILNKMDEERTELTKQARELDLKRRDYIAQKAKEDVKAGRRDSFDNRVLTILQRQAGRINVRYEAVQPKKK